MAADLEDLLRRSVELLEAANKVEETRQADGVGYFQVNNLAAQAANLVHSVTGPKSTYAEGIRHALKHKGPTNQWLALLGLLQGFHIDVSKNRLVNIRHEVEAVVVSEILTQARKLLRAKGVHPAASVIVACAGAEEFLRSWCEEKGCRSARGAALNRAVCRRVAGTRPNSPPSGKTHSVVGRL